jgi:hypothetical protein
MSNLLCNARMFSKVIVLFVLPPTIHESPHPCQHLLLSVFFFFFVIVIQEADRSHLIVVLICISLVATGFHCLLAIFISLEISILFSPLF